MILATRHIGIVVKDMEKSLYFWRDIMGLRVVADFWEESEYINKVQNLTNVKLHMIKLSGADGVLIELLKDHHHSNLQVESNLLCDRGIRHIAFTVGDVEECWKVFKETGCETLSEPVRSPDGKARLFFGRDPEGNLLEMVQMLTI